MIKKEKNTKIKKFFTFPERMNNVALFLIVLLVFVLVVVLDACVLPKNDYKHEPEYQEVKYTDYFNPHVRVLNNYVYDVNTEEITNKYRAIACYFAYATTDKIIDYKTDALFVTENGEFYYKGDSDITTSSSYTSTDYLINNDALDGSLIERIYFKVDYTKYQNNQRTTQSYVTFKEEVLSLTKKELKMDVCNDFVNLSNIISSISMRYENIESEQEVDGKKVKSYSKKLYNSIKINSTYKENFHIDMQVFGVDAENEVYNLMGVYGLCNNVSDSFELDSTFTDKLGIEYVIIKCVFEDENTEGKQVFYLKKALKDIDKV